MSGKNEFLKLNALFPLDVWNVKRGHGSFLIFNLRSKEENPEKLISNSLNMWVYLCKWSLTKDKINILSSYEEDNSIFEKILSKVEGLKIISIKEISPFNKVEIVFSEKFMLHLESDIKSYGQDEDLIIIYRQQGSTWAYSPLKGLYTE